MGKHQEEANAVLENPVHGLGLIIILICMQRKEKKAFNSYIPDETITGLARISCSLG